MSAIVLKSRFIASKIGIAVSEHRRGALGFRLGDFSLRNGLMGLGNHVLGLGALGLGLLVGRVLPLLG